MYRILELIIAAVITVLLFLLIGVFLPSHARVERSVELGNPITQVYDTLNHYKRWNSWQPWYALDTRADYSLEGAEYGVGAKVNWNSLFNKQVGQGSVEITESVPEERIVMALDNTWRGHDKTMTFELDQSTQTNAVTVRWAIDVDYGWDLLGRYSGMYVSRHVGDDMKMGLGRIVSMLAAVPNVDYAVSGSKLTGFKVVDRAAEDLLVVTAGSVERGNSQIQASITANSEWIRRVMDANGLEAVGPVRIVTTELGRETYNFDVVQPVRKQGGGALGNVALQGPVKLEQVKAGKVATASYTGYMAELENARNALRAWTLTSGHEVTGRAYESYKSGVANAFTENGEFDVYWPLK